MKLHRIRLENFRAVETCEFEFPDRGVVVIEGPNEAGKSSLVEAFELALDRQLKPGSRAARVTNLRPIGENVGTTMEVEMTLGTHRVIVTKTFNKGSGMRFQELAPGRRDVQGDEAAAALAELLDAHLDAHLLAALLWLQETQLTGSMDGLTGIREVSRALDAVAQGNDASDDRDGSDDLLERVRREYETYHTAKKGDYTADVQKTLDAAEKARLAREELEMRYEEVERELRELAGLQARRTQDLEALPGLEETERQARKARDDAMEAADRLAELHSGRDACAAVAATARDRRERRAQSIAELADRETRLVVAAAELAAAEQASAVAEDALAPVSDRLSAATEAAAEARARVRHLRSMVDLCDAVDRVAILEEFLRQDAALADEAARAAAEARGLRIDAAGLVELEAAERALVTAVAVRDAAAARLRIDGPAGRIVEVDGETLELDDEPYARPVTEPVRVWVGDIVISVEPPTTTDGRVLAVEEAVRARDELLVAAGCPDVPAARVAAARAEELAIALATLAGRRASLPGRPAGDAGEELAAACADVASLRATTDVADDPERPSTAELRAAEELSEVSEATVVELREQEMAARELCTDRVGKAAGVRARREGDVAERDRLMAEIERAREIEDDAAVEGAVTDAEAALAVAEERLAVEGPALRAVDTVAARIRHQSTEAEVQNRQRRVHDLRVQIADLQGRLRSLGAEGLHDRLEAARDAELAAVDEAERVRLRARAAGTLLATITRHRAEATRRYVGPFRERLEQLGRIVFGEPVGFDIGEGLEILSRDRGGVVVPTAQLSSGTREQLGILVRLVLAGLVDRTRSAPVFIDDALGFADPERLRMMGAALREAGRNGQVLVLTCTPDRFDSASPVARFQLPGARR